MRLRDFGKMMHSVVHTQLRGRILPSLKLDEGTFD